MTTTASCGGQILSQQKLRPLEKSRTMESALVRTRPWLLQVVEYGKNTSCGLPRSRETSRALHMKSFKDCLSGEPGDTLNAKEARQDCLSAVKESLMPLKESRLSKEQDYASIKTALSKAFHKTSGLDEREDIAKAVRELEKDVLTTVYSLCSSCIESKAAEKRALHSAEKLERCMRWKEDKIAQLLQEDWTKPLSPQTLTDYPCGNNSRSVVQLKALRSKIASTASTIETSPKIELDQLVDLNSQSEQKLLRTLQRNNGLEREVNKLRNELILKQEQRKNLIDNTFSKAYTLALNQCIGNVNELNSERELLEFELCSMRRSDAVLQKLSKPVETQTKETQTLETQTIEP